LLGPFRAPLRRLRPAGFVDLVPLANTTTRRRCRGQRSDRRAGRLLRVMPKRMRSHGWSNFVVLKFAAATASYNGGFTPGGAYPTYLHRLAFLAYQSVAGGW
jgi:hypothetical protein